VLSQGSCSTLSRCSGCIDNIVYACCCCLQALHEAIPPSSLPPELGGSLEQANPLEWLQQQIEQQEQEQLAAEQSKAKHAAGVAGLRSFVIADEEDAAVELGGD
jgi:hypothetical protein